MRILKILFILLLIVFPFGELLRFDLSNNIRFKPLDVIAIGIFLCWLLLAVRKRIHVNIRWYYFLFPVICVFSLVINSFWLQTLELLASSLYLIRWISYAGVFFAMLQLETSFQKKLLPLLVIDGLLIVLVGFVQYFFFSDLKPLYHLGWDDHMYRLFSVFLDPNYTGGFFVLYLMFIGGLLQHVLSNKKITRVAVFLGKPIVLHRKHLIIGLSFISALAFIALLLTFSRSSLIMLIVSSSVFFLMIGKRRLILALFSVLTAFTLLLSSQFYIENMNLFRYASSAARVENYQDALTISKDYPILGVGFNTYRYAKETYQIRSGWTNAPSHADAGVDNSFLFTLVTTGIVGLLAYAFLWFFVLKRAFTFYKDKHDMYALIVFSSGIGLFAHSMFINSLFFPAIMLWMWIMIGFTERRLR